MPWAADNGAFSGFDEMRFRRMLGRLPAGALFVASPDIVSDHEATLELWAEWAPRIREAGQRPAFVLQDGCASPPSDATALFIGGGTNYKLSRDVEAIVRSAVSQGIWVHMGRVNSRRRLFYAHSIGCHSIDGTKSSRYPDLFIPKLLAWAEIAHRQGELF